MWIQGTLRGFKVYYLETNSLVSVHQREYHVCFLQSSATSVGIIALTYTSMMANQRNNNHHNYNNEVEGAVHTRAAFHQFREETQQIIGEIQQMIAALLARKSSYNNNDQYIQRRTPNKKIALFDGDMCKLDFIDWLLDLEEYFNF